MDVMAEKECYDVVLNVANHSTSILFYIEDAFMLACSNISSQKPKKEGKSTATAS